MIWKAVYKDGTVIRQFEGKTALSYKDIDKEKLDRFIITESSGDTAVQFSADSGVMKFNNLDYMKTLNLKGGEELKLVYDKDKEVFKMDPASIELIKSIILEKEQNYFYIELNQRGEIIVGGQVFYMAFSKDGKEYKFIDNPPYHDFRFVVDTNEDFAMNGNIPIKKNVYNTAYSLVLHKEHKCDIGVFDINYTVKFDVLKSMVLLDCIISCNRNLRGNLVMYFGNRTANPIEFFQNEKKLFKKVLTLM